MRWHDPNAAGEYEKMTDITSLKAKLDKFGQAHLLDRYGELTPPEQDALVKQINSIDFAKVTELFRQASGLAVRIA